ncbi:MAG TPA: gliding motility-associated C-terminal domain-containing protein, partial [Chitinophagaceae bacterium]
NGVVIATQRKDLQIKLAPCSIAAASLPDEYLLCKTSMTLTPVNQSTSPLINTTYWEFLNNANQLLFSSTLLEPSFTFPDTGLYKVRLVINRGDACADSTTSIVRVYPGFRADFSYLGECFTKPTRFTDLSTTVYGIVNGWSWDFGDITMDNDQSTIRNPQYTYPDMGWKTSVLIAKNSKGCLDTVYKDISIVEKPPVNLAFRDTLICKNDQLQLQAIGNGQYSWTPNTNIINANTATPVVSPQVTTTYFVHMDDDGCTNTDSVKVRVVNAVTLQAMNDTTICAGDTIQLRINTDGLQYNWSPAANLNTSNISMPVAVTHNTTTYTITSTIGGCNTTDEIIVRTVPYPNIHAGADTTICYGTAAYLNATTDAAAILWAGTGMNISAILPNPVVHPRTSTTYIVSATDNRGCPKRVYDSIRVNVLPKINAFAGRDTSVITGQLVQLNASGGVQYAWSPSLYLSASNIADPKAVFDDENERIRYKVMVYDNEGCRDSAFITVRIFKTGPMVFVPTAFTPNNDGKNDRLKPIAAGISKIEYFRVFNRWGQLVYSSQVSGEGWDGMINGHMQGAGTYVWVVKAMDYRGEPYLKKGIVTLIR